MSVTAGQPRLPSESIVQANPHDACVKAGVGAQGGNGPASAKIDVEIFNLASPARPRKGRLKSTAKCPAGFGRIAGAKTRHARADVTESKTACDIWHPAI